MAGRGGGGEAGEGRVAEQAEQVRVGGGQLERGEEGPRHVQDVFLD